MSTEIAVEPSIKDRIIDAFEAKASVLAVRVKIPKVGAILVAVLVPLEVEFANQFGAAIKKGDFAGALDAITGKAGPILYVALKPDIAALATVATYKPGGAFETGLGHTDAFFGGNILVFANARNGVNATNPQSSTSINGGVVGKIPGSQAVKNLLSARLLAFAVAQLPIGAAAGATGVGIPIALGEALNASLITAAAAAVQQVDVFFGFATRAAITVTADGITIGAVGQNATFRWADVVKSLFPKVDFPKLSSNFTTDDPNILWNFDNYQLVADKGTSVPVYNFRFSSQLTLDSLAAVNNPSRNYGTYFDGRPITDSDVRDALLTNNAFVPALGVRGDGSRSTFDPAYSAAITNYLYDKFGVVAAPGNSRRAVGDATRGFIQLSASGRLAAVNSLSREEVAVDYGTPYLEPKDFYFYDISDSGQDYSYTSNYDLEGSTTNRPDGTALVIYPTYNEQFLSATPWKINRLVPILERVGALRVRGDEVFPGRSYNEYGSEIFGAPLYSYNRSSNPFDGSFIVREVIYSNAILQYERRENDAPDTSYTDFSTYPIQRNGDFFSLKGTGFQSFFYQYVSEPLPGSRNDGPSELRIVAARTVHYQKVSQYSAEGVLTQEVTIERGQYVKEVIYDIENRYDWKERINFYELPLNEISGPILNEYGSRQGNGLIGVAPSSNFLSSGGSTPPGETISTYFGFTPVGGTVDYDDGRREVSTGGLDLRRKITNVDGTYYITELGVEGQNAWRSRTSYFSADGRLLRDSGEGFDGTPFANDYGTGIIRNADGSFQLTIDDPQDSEAYSTLTQYYNAQGILVRSVSLLDGGQTIELELDGTRDQRTKSEKLIDRDGSSVLTVYDLANEQPWRQRTSTYSSAGVLLSESGTNDDGTYFNNDYRPQAPSVPERTDNPDGSYSIRTVDTTNSTWWTDNTVNYSPSGVVVSETGLADAGFRYRLIRNSEGTITEFDRYNADGTRDETFYEINGQWAGWSDHTNYYDTLNRALRQTGLYDDGNRWDRQWENGYGNAGSSSITVIDANNDEWYQSYTITYDTSGTRVIQQNGIFDSGDSWQWTWENGYGNPGSSSISITDANNDEFYRSFTNTYDTSGTRIIQQNGIFDNGDNWQWIWENGYGNAGTSERIDWDTSGTKPWWQQVADYNAANQLTRFETIYDDNTKVVDSFSNDANAGWIKRTDTFSATGALTGQVYT